MQWSEARLAGMGKNSVRDGIDWMASPDVQQSHSPFRHELAGIQREDISSWNPPRRTATDLCFLLPHSAFSIGGHQYRAFIFRFSVSFFALNADLCFERVILVVVSTLLTHIPTSTARTINRACLCLQPRFSH